MIENNNPRTDGTAAGCFVGLVTGTAGALASFIGTEWALSNFSQVHNLYTNTATHIATDLLGSFVGGVISFGIPLLVGASADVRRENRSRATLRSRRTGV